jgi:hypothetical protein
MLRFNTVFILGARSLHIEQYMSIVVERIVPGRTGIYPVPDYQCDGYSTEIADLILSQREVADI